jgi:hypothetical protein
MAAVSPPVNDLDEASVKLVRLYQEDGSVAFLIRTTDEGHVRVIGLSLPKHAVAQMLRSAADEYERQAPCDGKAN